jgi:co-chaperonin GroES (HSP10)|tara:strand:+ start:56 stop:316 length:261 start_codon:yes stop_codon:yes gene_type:complete
MKAVGKYIVINDIQGKTTSTRGGLLLSSKQREDIRYQEGEVLNPGTEVTLLKKGDRIFYDVHASLNIEINKEIFKVIKEKDIVIIL